jgi:DNA-binding Xre family transcriptional regulator
MNLEKNIKIKMVVAGIDSKTELCEMINISRPSLDYIFKKNDCKISTLIKIAEVLNCSVLELIQ